jgi:hypothetical protein
MQYHMAPTAGHARALDPGPPGGPPECFSFARTLINTEEGSSGIQYPSILKAFTIGCVRAADALLRPSSVDQVVTLKTACIKIWFYDANKKHLGSLLPGVVHSGEVFDDLHFFRQMFFVNVE